MSTAEQHYRELFDISRQTQVWEGISHLLGWDQETYMPPEADQIRAEQLKAVASLIHQRKTNPEFAKALAKLIDLDSGKIIAAELTAPQQAALKLWRRDYRKDTALPNAFVEEFTALSSLGQTRWRKAKKQNAFADFAPTLEKIVAMCRRKADYLGYEEHPYDALLDLYEPGISTKAISELFGSLKYSIRGLVKRIAAAPQVDDSFLFGSFDADQQLKFGQKLLEGMGFSMATGRLDLSTHPFSSSPHPLDNRITTRIHPKSLASNIFAVLHEGGHALYEMALPVDQYGSPLGQPISYGMHESQSRWWETRIGKSMPFWQHYLPILKQHFPGLNDVSLQSFYRGINKVEPSLIRIEADEVTYPLHVILRFELERALIEGSLSVADLPAAWNSGMKELLGVEPKTDSEGCLQDIHWSMGAFGYFPSYALGNLYGSQLFLAFTKQFPTWKERLAAGEMAFIKEWLNQNVHAYGRQYGSIELLDKVTGKPFSAQAHSDYLNDKYSEIYAI